METTKNTINNKKTFTVSNTTSDMLNALNDFMALQCRIIALFEGKEEGDNVIDTTVATYHAMRDAITANISETLAESHATRL